MITDLQKMKNHYKIIKKKLCVFLDFVVSYFFSHITNQIRNEQDQQKVCNESSKKPGDS
jgi:hypothetical protein